MSLRDVFFWLLSFTAANPIFTHFMIVRRANVTNKGKTLIHIIITLMLLFWCGVATRYFILSVISLICFAVAVPFRKSLFRNVRVNCRTSSGDAIRN